MLAFKTFFMSYIWNDLILCCYLKEQKSPHYWYWAENVLILIITLAISACLGIIKGIWLGVIGQESPVFYTVIFSIPALLWLYPLSYIFKSRKADADMYRKANPTYIKYSVYRFNGLLRDVELFIQAICSRPLGLQRVRPAQLNNILEEPGNEALLRHIYEKEFQENMTVAIRLIPGFDKVNRCPCFISTRYENELKTIVIYATVTNGDIVESKYLTLYLDVMETERGQMLNALED